jgi:putative flippase GtrA
MMRESEAPRLPWLRLERPRALRYLLVGAACAGLHNFVMIAADWAGFHYVWATIMAFGIVTPIAFWLHSRFTFGAALSWRNLGTFAAGIAAGFPLSLGAMAVLCSGLHLTVPFAAPIATVVLLAWNYVSARFAITRRLGFRSPA